MICFQLTQKAVTRAASPADTGIILMQALPDYVADESFALCGGCCSRGTRHEFIGKVSEPCSTSRQDEGALLEMSEHRPPNSRLSYPILVTEELDGQMISIAPTGIRRRLLKADSSCMGRAPKRALFASS